MGKVVAAAAAAAVPAEDAGIGGSGGGGGGGTVLDTTGLAAALAVLSFMLVCLVSVMNACVEITFRIYEVIKQNKDLFASPVSSDH